MDFPQIPRYLADFSYDKSFYLIQEFVDGIELSTQKLYSEAEVVATANQLLNVLVYLESLNLPLVHHDIKPQNILVDKSGKIHLIDFGIAQNQQGSTLNFTAAFSGTEGFIAPEKFLGKKADTRSDLYSLGITLACMITNTQPSKAVKLLNDDFELSSDILTSGYSPELIDWVIKLARRKPIDRYNNSSIAKACLARKIEPVEKSLFNIKEFVGINSLSIKLKATLLPSVCIAVSCVLVFYVILGLGSIWSIALLYICYLP